jgi:hypothetical protein
MKSTSFLYEGARLVAQQNFGNRAVKIYRDVEWNEFIVKFFLNSEHQVEADYHTNEKDDALSTAQGWLKKGSNISGPATGAELEEVVIPPTPGGTPAAPTANAAPASQGAVQSKPVTPQGVDALAQIVKSAGLTPSQLGTVMSKAK